MRADILQLDEVLDSVRRTHPALEQAQLSVRESDAKVLAAKGGFDPRVRIRGKWSPVGYYPNGQVDALVRQSTPLWGLSAYAGYRLGFGSYPVYKGELQTLSGGEIRAGLNVPLWRDGAIDKRRAKLRQARIARRGAEWSQLDQLRKLELDATKTYWSWVAAGQSLDVALELLAIAEVRDEGLRANVEAGGAPRIVLTDNQRLMLDRQAKVVSAQQKLQQAAVDLSLHLRDDDRQPVRVSEVRLPAAMPSPGAPAIDSMDIAVEQALQQRPDVRELDTARESAAVEVRLTKNQRGPAIDLQAFAARDMGDGPAELAPTELGVGVSVEMAIPLREARGNYQAAQAKASQLDAKRRALRDAVGAELRRAFVAVETARQRVELARQQREVALELAEAERERLRQGSSDLLAVNLREVAAADAANLEIAALAEYHQAHAELVAAMGGTALTN